MDDTETAVNDMAAGQSQCKTHHHCFERHANSVSRKTDTVEDRSRGKLGDKVWIGGAAALAAPFVAGKVLRRLPFGALASVLVPIVIAKLREKEAERRDRDRH